MRMRGIMLATALGMMASTGLSSAYPQMGGETSPFAFLRHADWVIKSCGVF